MKFLFRRCLQSLKKPVENAKRGHPFDHQRMSQALPAQVAPSRCSGRVSRQLPLVSDHLTTSPLTAR